MKNTLKLFIVVIIYNVLSHSCFSQTITVYDYETHIPISNVVIFDESELHSVITDKNGIADISIFEDPNKYMA